LVCPCVNSGSQGHYISTVERDINKKIIMINDDDDEDKSV